MKPSLSQPVTSSTYMPTVPTPTPTYAHTTPALALILLSSRHITDTLCVANKKLGFQKLGLHSHEIGSYSLWSRQQQWRRRRGVAMILHITGVPEHTIKITGRWRSDAFLIYLQGQITTFTQGVAAAMAKVQWFKHTTALTFSKL